VKNKLSFAKTYTIVAAAIILLTAIALAVKPSYSKDVSAMLKINTNSPLSTYVTENGGVK